MDDHWEPYWHVFLGKQFGCHAVHERNRFVYFSFEASKISFLIYKASWALVVKFYFPYEACLFQGWSRQSTDVSANRPQGGIYFQAEPDLDHWMPRTPNGQSLTWRSSV